MYLLRFYHVKNCVILYIFMYSFRSLHSSQYQNQPPIENKKNIMFPLFTRKNNQSTFSYFTNKKQSEELPLLQPPVKLKWGEPFWNLFHTMAEKIIPENYFRLKTEMFEIIRAICYNLPCPDCANHARNYINGININTIHTPQQLKEMFYVFHNFVNARKNLPLFPREELDKRYQSMNMKTTIGIFLQHFRDKHKSTRMLADDLHRAKLANKFEKWFIENLGSFQ